MTTLTSNITETEGNGEVIQVSINMPDSYDLADLVDVFRRSLLALSFQQIDVNRLFPIVENKEEEED